MTLVQLRHFVVLANEGSFVQASVVLFLQMLQSITIERHHARFRTGEKCGEEY